MGKNRSKPKKIGAILFSNILYAVSKKCMNKDMMDIFVYNDVETLLLYIVAGIGRKIVDDAQEIGKY